MTTQNKMIAWLEGKKVNADREDKELIDAIIERVKGYKKKEKAKAPERYKDFVEIYHQFCLDTIGVGAKMDASEGKALKSIIKYLIEQSKTQDTQGAIEAWSYVLDNWNMLSPFIQSQKPLKQINKNLIEILSQIKNGHAKSKQTNADNTREKLKQKIAERRQSGDH